jgi:hypothetical protein
VGYEGGHLKTFCLLSLLLKVQAPITPGANVIKLITAVLYKCSQKATVFVCGRSVQPNLIL